MEQNGYIIKVDILIEWVSLMVVLMRNNMICICLDLFDLNKVVKRIYYFMKIVEDIVLNIFNVCVFFKLDVKLGFFQIKLNEKLLYLIIFNILIGRYRWLCFLFGIKFVFEIFQYIMDQMFEGIEGVVVVMDDIFIGGWDVEYYDQIFRKVIERVIQYNLKFNYDKCEIRQL